MLKTTRKRLAILGGIGATVIALCVLVLVLLAHNPERRVAKLLQEAQIYKRTNQPEKETQALAEALAITPRAPGLMAKLARNVAQRGDLERAEKLLHDALEINPDNVG